MSFKELIDLSPRNPQDGVKEYTDQHHQELLDIAGTFSTPRGRRTLEMLREFVAYGEPSTHSATEWVASNRFESVQAAMLYVDGMKAVVHYILNCIEDGNQLRQGKDQETPVVKTYK